MAMSRGAFLIWNLLISLIMYIAVRSGFKNIDTGILTQDDYVKFSISYLIVDTCLRILPVRSRARDLNSNPLLWTGIALTYIGTLCAFQAFEENLHGVPSFVQWSCLGLMSIWVLTMIYFLLRRGSQVI